MLQIWIHMIFTMRLYAICIGVKILCSTNLSCNNPTLSFQCYDSLLNFAVKKVDPSSILSDVLSEDTSDRYDFCMCNPPFFGSHLEAWGMHSSRSDDRPEPMSVNTPSDSESVVQGGEVNFVAHIIADSVKLKDRIRLIFICFVFINYKL